MKPRIGIIGTGATVSIAHNHVQGLLADGRAEITAVYNRSPERSARFLHEHGLHNTLVCENFSQLLGCVDAVDICTPNNSHIEYVLGALQADKAVFVEKPLALTAKESRQAVEAIQGKDLFAMVGFVYRYALVIQELRKLVQEEIGRVYTFSGSFGGRRLANFNLPVEWRMLRKTSGSGALGDFGSHLVDLAYFTAGLYFESVSGMVSTVIPERPANLEGITRVENDDQAAFTARTAHEVLASFTVSRVGMDDLMLFVAGEGGLARVSIGHPEKIDFLPARNGVYMDRPKEYHVPPQEFFAGWFEGQMKAFVDGLIGLPVEVADLNQGHYVECVLEAVEKASALQTVRVEA